MLILFYLELEAPTSEFDSYFFPCWSSRLGVDLLLLIFQVELCVLFPEKSFLTTACQVGFSNLTHSVTSHYCNLLILNKLECSHVYFFSPSL